MPRAAWVALGAAAAALTATELGVRAALGGVAIGLALAIGAATIRGRRGHRGRTPIAAGMLGASLLAVRILAVGPPPMAQADLVGQDGTWRGAISTLSAPLDGRQRATLRLEGGSLVALTAPRYPQLRVADQVRVAGTLEAVPDGPYGTYLQRIGVVATLRTRILEPAGAPASPTAWVEAIRSWADTALAAALPEPEAGLASGILVGLRDRVDRSLAADFTAAGVSHVVAISGWNIAVVAAAVGAPLNRVRRGRRALVILAVVAAYTLLAGASPSVVRAALMAGVALTARELGRAGRAASFLAIAALAMLLVDPSVISDAGFRLSVAATAGLLVWASGIQAWLGSTRLGGHLPGWLLEALALSTAAQLATLPIVLASFGRLSLVAPLANLVVAPIVPPAMAASVLALAGGGLAESGPGVLAAPVLAVPGWALLTTLVGAVRILAAVPGASVELAPPYDLLGAAAATLLAIGLLPPVRVRLQDAWRRGGLGRPGAGGRRPRSDGRAVPIPTGAMPDARALAARRSVGRGGTASTGGDHRAERARRGTAVALTALLVLAVGGITAAGRGPDGRVRVVALDVGQGDAILVEGDRGGRLLVDGGPDPERLLVALDARVPPWDRHLDLIVVSHPHEDHVGGLPALLERYRVDRVLGTGMAGTGPGDQALRAELAERGKLMESLGSGDRIELDSVEFQVLWPDRGTVPSIAPEAGSEVNDRSLVLLGTVGATRILLTGDAEEGVDPSLLKRGLPPVDLLKVAHHGSRTATTAALLAATHPALALVSVGSDNPYGHPAPETLARLEAVGARVYRTDLDGTVVAAFDGRAWTVTTGERRAAAAMGTARAIERPPAGAIDPSGPPLPVPEGRRPAADATSVTGLGYHRANVRPEPRRGRGDPPVVRPAAVVPAPRAGGRRDRRLAGGPGGGRRQAGGPPARRGRGTPPRHRQAPRPIGPGPPTPARGGLRGLAGNRRTPGAGAGRRVAPRRPARRRRCRGLASDGHARGAHRGLRGQASGPAARAGGRPLRLLGAPLPAHRPGHRGPRDRAGWGRLGFRHVRTGPCAGRSTGA